MEQQYYTIKQMADMLHLSKQKVYRCIKSNCIIEAHHDTVKGNSVLMYDKYAFDKVKSILTASDEAHHEAHHDTVNETLYEALLKQLEEKDKQIEKLQNLLDQEQKLNAKRALELEQKETKQKELEVELLEEQQKSWWQKLIGR